jgi:hypothetical protein
MKIIRNQEKYTIIREITLNNLNELIQQYALTATAQKLLETKLKKTNQQIKEYEEINNSNLSENFKNKLIELLPVNSLKQQKTSVMTELINATQFKTELEKAAAHIQINLPQLLKEQTDKQLKQNTKKPK